MKKIIIPNLKFNILYILIIVAAVLAGCSNPEPKLTLSWEEDKMVDVLADLRIMDNQVKKHHVLDRDSVSQVYTALIYDIHKISEEDLIFNLKVMQGDAILSKRLEDQVLKKMVARKKVYEENDDYDN